jgi:PAS domain S-box-containing protein
MPRELRVLMVEDSEDDAALLSAELRRHEFAPVAERVETAEAMRHALESKTWDVILSDYRLPRFSGPAALALARELGHDVPFIMVSGTIGEETAVAALKAGAHDFVTKENLSRLCPAIEREMREAANRRELRRAGELLRRNEAHFRALIERSMDSIAILDVQGRITYESPAITPLLGYRPEELEGKPGFDFVHPDDQARVRRLLAEAVAGGARAVREEFRFRHKDGSWRTFEGVVTDLRDNPAVAGFVINSRDITERKQAELDLTLKNVILATQQETTLDGILVVDERGRMLSFNRRFVDLWGLPAELVAAKVDQPVLEYVGRQMVDPAAFLARVTYLYEHREEKSQEEIALKDGRTFDRYSAPMFGADGGYYGRVWYFRDVSERRRAERALRESETRLRSLFAGIDDALFVHDTEGRIIDCNEAACRRLGYSREELLAMRTSDVDAPEFAAGFRGRLERQLQSGRVTFEGLHVTKEGRRVPVDIHSSVIDYHGTRAVLALMRDITDRKHAEAVLAKSEQELRSVLDRMRLIGLVLDTAGRITYCNNYLAEVSGWPREELMGADYLSRFIPPGHPAIGVLQRAMETGEVAAHYANEILTRDGMRREIEWNNTLLRDSDGRLTGMVSIGEDVTDRRRSEEALRRSEADFRSLVEHSPLGIYRATPDGSFLTVNPALVKMLGYGWAEEMLRLDIARDVYAQPEQRANLVAEFAGRDDAEMETEWKRKDGSRITVRVSARAVRGPDGPMEYYEGLVEDVTEQRSLETQFRQAQRLEAVGRLAGGVAHDFNNVLTAITGYSDLLLEELGPGDSKRSDVEEIKAAALRATSLTRQLLAFSRKQVFQSRVLDLNEVVQTLEKMLRRLIGEDVKLGLSLTPALGAVRADPGQIEQVILNLAVNSRDAMASGGSLTIETANVVLDEAYAREHAGALPGRYVMLAVSDTGTGMDAETRSHIFEPFFTTKELGKGTGLGLSTVYGIVKQSGGYVWVYSEPGRGATFKVYLPLVDEQPEAVGLVAPPQPVAGGRETVLLAEDDPSVRAIVAEVLTQKGYRVLRAPDGQAALEMAHGHPEEISLLVTDIVMPGMTGRELAEALSAERPALRVLYMSGYTDDAVVRHGVLTEGMPYLQKPFAPRALASKVREVLDRA